MSVHFSSQRLDWQTPKAVYQILDAEFRFDYDPCPKDPATDGLTCAWGKVTFCNPPYGRQIAKWIKKGYEEWGKGKTVVFLIPSRTDTAYWHEYIMQAQEIRFVRGRLQFDDCGVNAPFPSAIVIFKANNNIRKE